MVRSGDLCFDVGAHLGDRTDVLSRLGARVVAVEPQHSLAEVLRRRFGTNSAVTVEETALGSVAGSADMRISDATTLSSLSPDWIRRVRESGRFADHEWTSRTEKVQVSTLDDLIDRHGKPRFCKIDVEGFEFEVLQGLTEPIHCVSYEFVPEYVEAAIRCAQRLDALGTAEFNLSLEESMVLLFEAWKNTEEMCSYLRQMDVASTAFGDIYARFPEIV